MAGFPSVYLREIIWNNRTVIHWQLVFSRLKCFEYIYDFLVWVSFEDKAANYYIVNRFVWTLILSHRVCCSIFVNCMIIAGGSKPIFLYCDLSVRKINVWRTDYIISLLIFYFLSKALTCIKLKIGIILSWRKIYHLIARDVSIQAFTVSSIFFLLLKIFKRKTPLKCVTV